MLKALAVAAALASVAAITGALGFFGRIAEIPHEEMMRMRAVMTSIAGVNAMGYSQAPGPDTQVVRNNPDTRTAFCWFSLADGPVRISGPLPETSYWSLSLYAPDGTNPVVLNDGDFAQSPRFDVILRSEAMQPPAGPASRSIVVDNQEGAAVLRYFLPSKDQEPEINALRRAARCEPLQP